MATVNDIKIECLRGDITKQDDCTAIVNAANAQLRIGGGVAGAIHRAAGPRLEEVCEPLAPIGPGQVVITEGCELPNDYVIHCLGPVYGSDEPSDKLLADCYRNALQLAEDEGIESIAFPALSTGAFGYPLEEAAEVAMRTVIETAKELNTVKLIRFCLFGEEAERVHQQKLEVLA